MILTVTIPGAPVPKARPIAQRIGDGVRLVTPKTTEAYETKVAWACRIAASQARVHTPISGPVAVEVEIVHARPPSMFRAVDPDGRVPRSRRPDFDNIVKAVLDGATQAKLWGDDGQVWAANVRQYDGAIVDRKARKSEPEGVTLTVMWEVGDVR